MKENEETGSVCGNIYRHRTVCIGIINLVKKKAQAIAWWNRRGKRTWQSQRRAIRALARIEGIDVPLIEPVYPGPLDLLCCGILLQLRCLLRLWSLLRLLLCLF
ncbi:hypothetical protein OS493_005205 [Desmophyllum pertusum]|uniref:Uncharacterized protein n=1 Tax=Desmophyllum pertusum TaxID=174260 RepID=A0A9W9Z4B7_9CNID|nr:hypothetical protein OS493_005205 [Desmophyllum pertusum]